MTSKHENSLSLHDHYVRAVNGALEAGRDHAARELAGAYADELFAARHKREPSEARPVREPSRTRYRRSLARAGALTAKVRPRTR